MTNALTDAIESRAALFGTDHRLSPTRFDTIGIGSTSCEWSRTWSQLIIRGPFE
jgi:hypothetical protein